MNRLSMTPPDGGGRSARAECRRSRRAEVIAILALLLASCAAPIPVVPIGPVQPPPVVGPVNPPPVVLPPPVVAPPADVAAFLDRIAIGATLSDVTSAVGAPSTPPRDDGRPTARWFAAFGETRWMIYAVFVAGKVTSKGAVRIEVVR